MSLALRKLEWARHALSAHRALTLGGADRTPESDESFRAQRKAYLDRITGDAGSGVADVSPYAPLAAADAIHDYFAELQAAGADPATLYAEGTRAEIISGRIPKARLNIPDYGGSLHDAETALFKKTVAAGALPDVTIKAAADVIAKRDADRANLPSREEIRQGVDNDLRALREAYQSANDMLAGVLAAAWKEDWKDPAASGAMAGDRSDVKAAEAAKNAAYDAYKKAYDSFSETVRAKWAEVDSLVNAETKAFGRKILDEILEQSPVTKQAADDWAKKIPLDKRVKAKLSRLKWPVAQFQADIAEFYRLTNGKLPQIRFDIEQGSPRAHATGISAAGGGVVFVQGSSFSRGTLFHEMGHHIEADPVAVALSKRFLIRRRTSETPELLRTLTGVKGYKLDEVAYPDAFISPYVGKVYRTRQGAWSNVTEVFSMGIEQMADPEKFAEAMAKDPEHMNLILGYLTSDESPLYAALKNITGEKLDVKRVVEEGEQKRIGDALDVIGVSVAHDKKAPEPEFIDESDRRVYRLGKWQGRLTSAKGFQFGVYAARSRSMGDIWDRKLRPCFSVWLIGGSTNARHAVHTDTMPDIRHAKVAAAHYDLDGRFPVPGKKVSESELNQLAQRVSGASDA